MNKTLLRKSALVSAVASLMGVHAQVASAWSNSTRNATVTTAVTTRAGVTGNEGWNTTNYAYDNMLSQIALTDPSGSYNGYNYSSHSGGYTNANSYSYYYNSNTTYRVVNKGGSTGFGPIDITDNKYQYGYNTQSGHSAYSNSSAIGASWYDSYTQHTSHTVMVNNVSQASQHDTHNYTSKTTGGGYIGSQSADIGYGYHSSTTTTVDGVMTVDNVTNQSSDMYIDEDQINLSVSDSYTDYIDPTNNTGGTSNLDMSGTEVSLTNTNSQGETHGIWIDGDSTTISGGTTSTFLTLDDNGAHLSSDGSVNGSAPVVLNGVASGSVAAGSTEAVNGGQMFTEQQARISADNTLTTNLNAEVNNRIADVNNEESARIAADNAIIAVNDKQDRQIHNLNNDVNDLQDGVAAALALTSAQQPSAPGKTAVSVGGGFYKGSNAIGLNAVHALDIGGSMQAYKPTIGLGVADAGGDTATKVSVGFEF